MCYQRGEDPLHDQIKRFLGIKEKSYNFSPDERNEWTLEANNMTHTILENSCLFYYIVVNDLLYLIPRLHTIQFSSNNYDYPFKERTVALVRAWASSLACGSDSTDVWQCKLHSCVHITIVSYTQKFTFLNNALKRKDVCQRRLSWCRTHSRGE